MNDSIETIQRIGHKLQALIKQRDTLIKENERLQHDLHQKQQLLDSISKKATLLEDQVFALKATTEQLDEKGRKELDKKINGFVKDIDRVIAHLQA